MERQYFWIVTSDPNTGKLYLIAGGNNEEEARQKAFETLGGVDFEIKMMRTRNLARASQMLRGTQLERTHDLTKSGRRIGHAKSISRWRDRSQEKTTW